MRWIIFANPKRTRVVLYFKRQRGDEVSVDPQRSGARRWAADTLAKAACRSLAKSHPDKRWGVAPADATDAEIRAALKIPNLYRVSPHGPPTLCNPKGRSSKRRRNPVPPSSKVKLDQAAKLFHDFTGHKPAFTATRKIKVPDTGLQVGSVDGILYTTVRDGRTEKYVHRFKRSARPLLAASHDGRTLVLVGGRYQFTDRGIVDR